MMSSQPPRQVSDIKSSLSRTGANSRIILTCPIEKANGNFKVVSDPQLYASLKINVLHLGIKMEEEERSDQTTA